MSGKTKTQFKLWWIPLIAGIFFILFGAIIIKKPLASFYAMSLIIGIFLIASGTAEIYLFTYHRKKLIDWNWHLSGGLVDLLLGVILILNPKIILIGLTFLISLWLFYRTYVAIKKAIELKNEKNKDWIWVLFFGIIILALAVLLIIRPGILGKALAFWIAISFIVFGVFRVFFALKLRNTYQHYH